MFSTKPRKIKNYDVNAVNVAFVVDRLKAKSFNETMGKQFDLLLIDAENEDKPRIQRSKNGWIWNVATIIGTQYHLSTGSSYVHTPSELNYRICFFHASAKNMENVERIIEDAKAYTLRERIEDTFSTSVNFSRNRKQKETTAAIKAENYFLNEATLLGCAIISERTDNSYISSNAGLLTFEIPSRRPHEYLL